MTIPVVFGTSVEFAELSCVREESAAKRNAGRLRAPHSLQGRVRSGCRNLVGPGAIRNRTGKRAWCEAIFNDDIYREKYATALSVPVGPDQHTIVLGRRYRDRLGIRSQRPLRTAFLTITCAPAGWWHPRRWWMALRLSLQHPVSTNRLATYIALLGALLGAIGLAIGIASLV
jgi:hypothetical protein